METIVEKLELADSELVKGLISSPLLDSKVKTKLRAYQKHHIGDNQYRVEYVYGEAGAKLKVGRLFARKLVGLQSFPKAVRTCLSAKYYVDCDMENALPNITLHLLRSRNIEHSKLEQYCNNRAAILEEKKITKNDVLIKMCDGGNRPADDFFADIHDKIYQSLVPLLQTEFPKLWKSVNLKGMANKKDPRSSFFTQIVQNEENRILLCMDRILKEKGFHPDTLIFDGLLIRKDPRLNEELLKDLEQNLMAEFGFKIRLAYKAMTFDDEALKLLQSATQDNLRKDCKKVAADAESNIEEEESDSDSEVDINSLSVSVAKHLVPKPNKLLEYLNKFFAKVTDEGTIWYCMRWKTTDPWIWRGKGATNEATEHLSLKIDKGCRPLSLFRWWCKQPKMATFKNLVFDPSQVGDVSGKHINLFRGFQAKRVEQVDMQKLRAVLHHLKDVINDGSDADFIYNLKWQASIVQHKYKKNGTALVNFGRQGTGKNTYWEWFGEYILGKEHYCYLSSVEDITGQFTALYACKIFVICDEITYAHAHKSNNKLKSLITQGWQKLEKKGHDPVMMDSFMNMVFLSNGDCPVKIEQDDRRYVPKRQSSKYRGNLEYFENLHACLNQETANHMYTYLMDMDLTDFRVRDIPKSGEKEEMKLYSMPPLALFREAMLGGSVIFQRPYEGDNHTTEPIYFTAGEEYHLTMDKLHEIYSQFLASGRAGMKQPPENMLSFGKLVRRELSITTESSHRKGGVRIKLVVERVKEEDSAPTPNFSVAEPMELTAGDFDALNNGKEKILTGPAADSEVQPVAPVVKKRVIGRARFVKSNIESRTEVV